MRKLAGEESPGKWEVVVETVRKKSGSLEMP